MSTDFKELNGITYKIIGCAYKVHRELGPGLLESTYEACHYYEMNESGLFVERQKELPLIYHKIKLDAGYRIDLLVARKIIVEVKSVEDIAPNHKAQILTYMKLSKVKLGLLINFNSINLKKGIQRFVL
ncbi:MAG: GxxExxY protein [Bacteroidetes bacterium]|nr:GxxExxY protein [Bacteroidota bacterium]